MRTLVPVFLGLMLAGCGDPAAYPRFAGDTAPDTEVPDGGGSGAGGGSGDDGGITLPSITSACALAAADACSSGGATSMFLQVSNLSDRDVDLYWVDGSCNLAFYGTATASGGTLDQQTYDTHIWALVDKQTGTELGRIASELPDPCVVEVQ